MIRLNVSEQQLFDIIMAVYSIGNGEDGQQEPETVRRREALLDKLHRAFDSKIITPRAVQAGAPVRAGGRNAQAAASGNLRAHAV
jgi:hypothetical protein